jgi:hypothetical protein
MNKVVPIQTPTVEGKRRALVLVEDRVGHYPEFRDFFIRTFDLQRIGLAEPGYVAAPSGFEYALVFVGRSGEPFPSGLELYLLAPELEPFDERIVDLDLWAIMRWLIAGVGGAWTVDDLEATGRLCRLPASAH